MSLGQVAAGGRELREKQKEQEQVWSESGEVPVAVETQTGDFV